MAGSDIFRRRIAMLAGLAAFALSACAEGDLPGFLRGEEPETPAMPVGPADPSRDTEAPDLFELTSRGLWDGRPSLGGVWVAHPDVTDPRRVIIRNEDKDTSVVGALFRREREIAGPALQVSSDAAEALEMLAGAPAMLRVTALTRAEPAPEEDAAEAGTQVIRVGSYSSEEAARDAARRLRDNGLTPDMRATEGELAWIVEIAADPADIDSVMTDLIELGFDEAEPV